VSASSLATVLVCFPLGVPGDHRPSSYADNLSATMQLAGISVGVHSAREVLTVKTRDLTAVKDYVYI